MHTPFLSVCIPVYNTEQYLAECLKSVIDQDFADYEILVLSDSSSGHDQNGRDCKAIVKSFKKPFSKPSIRYLEHSQNKGLVEARRTLVYVARGEYIFMLDSDDFLAPGALAALANAAKEKDSDIVQGSSREFYNDIQRFRNEFGMTEVGQTESKTDENGHAESKIDENCHAESKTDENCHAELVSASQKETTSSSKVYFGELFGDKIFRTFFVEHEISSYLWGKLIRREIYLQALNEILPTYCNIAEDLLQFFFITRYAKSYLGIEKLVYNYRKTSGMTSTKKIDNLRSWEMVCSTASVFTILFDWNKIDENTFRLTPEEHAVLQHFSQYYIKNNYKQYTEAVLPELKPQAYALLCDYWGENFVKRISEES